MLLLWCLSMIQVFNYPLGKRSFHLFLFSSKQLFFVSGTISPQVLRCFNKSTTSLCFSLLVFQQIRSILICKDAFQVHLWQKISFYSPSLYPNNLASILSFRRHCDVALFTNLLELRIMFFSCLSI